MSTTRRGPDDRPAPDEEKEDSSASSWKHRQIFLLLAVLAFAIADLVLTVHGRGITQKTLNMAQEALGTAKKASATLSDQASKVGVLGTQITELYSQEVVFSHGLANLTRTVEQLQSKVKVLQHETLAKTTTHGSPSSTTSAVAGSSTPWSVGVRQLPEGTLVWTLLETILALLL